MTGNDTDKGKLQYLEKNLSQLHFVHHKYHMDWPGPEPGAQWWEAGKLTAWAMALPLKHKLKLNNTYIFCSHLTVNTVSTRNANQLMLWREIAAFFVRVIANIYIYIYILWAKF